MKHYNKKTYSGITAIITDIQIHKDCVKLYIKDPQTKQSR
jgi:hypothetical protein